MPANQFLFINKDPTSRSLSNNRSESALAYSKINKHVQRLSARQRLKSKSLASRSAAQPLVGWNNQSPLSPPVSDDTRTESVTSGGDRDDDDDDDFDEEIRSPLMEGQDNAFSPPTLPEDVALNAAVDSLPNTVVKISSAGHQVLQYFLSVWMPSSSHIPPGCQIAGYTPIWPNDLDLSTRVMQGALQNDDTLSVHSLLAASSRRMQALHRQRFNQPGLPELHTLQAVQALRKRAESDGPLNERLILDISYLILADLYAEIPSRSEIYYRISRDLIVRFGGLQRLDPFVTQAALAYDYFHSIGTLTMPTIDPLHDTALLGIPTTTPRLQAKALAQAQLDQLEPRLRMTAQIKHAFARTLRCILALPQPAVAAMKDLMTHHVPQLYPVLAGPFSQSPTQSAAPNDPNPITLMAADTLSIQTRNILCHSWLWLSALGCAGYLRTSETELDPWASAHATYPPPAHISRASRSWRQLDRIEELLRNTGWEVKAQLALWQDAVGYLTATNREDQRAWAERFVRQVQVQRIEGEEGLAKGLASHLPLGKVASNWLGMLWQLVETRRRVSEAESVTSIGTNESAG